ncbi:MAG: tetraacyldisaccharide 4'-kinase [Thermodesulfovibrio sp.]
MNLFERAYLFFYKRKKQKALESQKKLPFPVISVGNLTVGGTGKTPFTIALAKELKKRGYIPIILTRGYRGSLKGPVIVNDKFKAEEVGDEALMMAMEGLTVVKCADRYKGGIYAIENLSLSDKENAVFILDDGFQHWSLYRDLNILLFDGFKDIHNLRLLPFGTLRSPLSEIYDAQMIFITKKENENIYQYLKNSGIKEVYFAPFKFEGIISIDGKKIEPKGQKVFAFAGIANFQSFLHFLSSLGLKVIGYKKFIDHKRYTERTLRKVLKLADEAELIITTKKDIVKIMSLDLSEKRLFFLEISMKITDQAVDKIQKLTHNW